MPEDMSKAEREACEQSLDEMYFGRGRKNMEDYYSLLSSVPEHAVEGFFRVRMSHILLTCPRRCLAEMTWRARVIYVQRWSRWAAASASPHHSLPT